MKGKKRLIALLLSFLMVMSQMSVATFALDTVAADNSDQAVTEQAVEETQPDADVTVAAVEKEPVAEESATETATEPEAAEPAAAEPEKTEPAAEPAKAEAKKAEPKKEEPKEEAFDQSKTVSGVTVRVKAAKGVFPAGSKLSVSSVSVPSAVDTEDAEEAYAFDISILADGKKIQPDGNATVSFTTEEVAEYDTAVYHMDGVAQELNVSESGKTAAVVTDSFSTYVLVCNPKEQPSETTEYNLGIDKDKFGKQKVTDVAKDVTGEDYSTRIVKASNNVGRRNLLTVTEEEGTWYVEINDESTDETDNLCLRLDSSTGELIVINVKVEERPVATFMNDTTEYAEVVADKDGIVTKPAEDPKSTDPEKTFDHWYVGDTDTGAYDFANPITVDTVFHAAWKEHQHQWRFNGTSKPSEFNNKYSKATIKCDAEGCPYGTYTVELTGEDTTYNEQEHPIGLTNDSEGVVETSSIRLEKDGETFTGVPKDAGKYTAYVDITKVGDTELTNVRTLKKEITISKATPTVEPPKKKDDTELIIIGSDPLELLTGASETSNKDEGAEVQYQLKDEDGERVVPYSKGNAYTKIAVTTAGTYTARTRVQATTNYEAVESKPVTIVVKGPIVVEFDPNGGTGPEMEKQVVAEGVETELRTCTYSMEGFKFLGWSNTPNPTWEQVDYPLEDGVCKGTFTANKTIYAVWQEYAHELNPPKALSLTYNGDEQELINDGSVVEGQGVMKYSVNEEGPFTQALPKGVTAGDYTVYYMIEGANGYAYTEPKLIENVSIDAKKVTATGFEAEDKLYDGNKDAELVMDGEHVKADIEDLVGDDEVYVESADASFEDAAVGNNKKVNVTNIVLGGADAANYELTSTTAETTASITHEHSWQSEAKEGVVTLTCSQEACPYHDNPIHIYLNAESVSYDGKPHPAELDTSEIPEELKGQIDVRWKNDTTSQKVFYRKDGASPAAIEPLDPAVYKGYTRVRYKDSTGKNVTVNLTKEFTISEKTVTIYGVTAEDKVYDGNNTATVNADDAVIEGLVPGDVVTVAVRTEGASNAGLFENEKAGNDKKVTWSNYVLGGEDAYKYVVSPDSQYEATASIFKKPVTFLWSIDGEEYDPEDPPVYDGKHHIVTALVNHEDIVGEDVVGAHLTGTTEARNVAPFDYTAEVDRLVGKDKDNYKFDLDDETASLNWNLEKADLTIQANDVELTYGDDPYNNGVTYTGLVASDKSRVNPDRPARGVIDGALQFKYHVRGDKKTEYVAGSDASEFVDKGYVVDPKSSELSATNYEITLKVGTLTVNKKHVVFSWDKVNPSKIYDGEPLTVEATTDDIIDQDQDKVIEAYLPDDLKNSATNVEDSHLVIAYIDDINDDVQKARNYIVDSDSNAENTITITARPVEVVWQYDGPYTYDGTTKSVSAIIKGAVADQKLTPVTSGVLEAKDAGSYVAKVTDFEAVDPALKDNYELKSTDRSLTWSITPATVTVTANNQTIYNTDNYDKAAVSYSGFAPGESASVLTAVPTVSSDYYVNAKAGKYTLVPSGAAAKNYTFRYANGTLTVNEKGTVLVARGRAKGGNTINVSWTNYTGADRYVVYYGICGKMPMKYYKAVWSNTRSLDVTGLSRGTQYKFYVYAQKNVNGNFVNIARSNGFHVIAGNVSGGYTNPSRVVLSRYEGSMPVGGKYKIKASVSKTVPGRDLLGTNHDVQLTYRSSNDNVAKVSKNGVVYAVGKGTCRIYVMSISGVYSTMILTVY